MRIIAPFVAAPLLMALGCASLDARSDVERSADLVGTAVGLPSALLLADDHAAKTTTARLLEGGLSAAEAAQVALLNNPTIRAAMLSIGISRADFVQSTLFSNPALALSLRLPDGGGLANLEVALTQNIAELWLIPARVRAAQRDLDRTVLEAAQTAARTVLDVRRAYVRAARAASAVDIARETSSLTRRLGELAELRREAGSGSEIDVTLARAQMLESQAALRIASLTATEARSDLARLLGLGDAPDSLTLTDAISEPWDPLTSAEQLQALARRCRLDLRIADKAVAGAESRVQQERQRFLRSVEIGVALERGERGRRGDRDWAAESFYDSLQSGALTPPNPAPRPPEETDVLVGPTLSVELPLWDQNQARIAKAERTLQQSVQLRDALLVDLAQDIHSRLARAAVSAEIARFYREEQLPNAQRSADLARDAYRAGRTPLFSVLEADRALLAARNAWLSALEAAALAAIDLERVTGRPVDVLRSLPPAAATSRPTQHEVQP